MSDQTGDARTYKIEWYEMMGGFRLARIFDLEGTLLLSRFSVPQWMTLLEAELEVYANVRWIKIDHKITHEGDFAPPE